MTVLQEYQAKAIGLMNENLAINDKIANCGLGVADELGELAEIFFTDAGLQAGLDKDTKIAHIREELGDLLWYCCVGMYQYGLTTFDPARITTSASSWLYDDDAIQEFHTLLIISNPFIRHAKRTAFHGHPITDEVKSEVNVSAHAIISKIVTIASITGAGTLADIVAENLKKLYKRYPDGKFSTEHSINRSV